MRIAFLTHQWPGARMGGIGAAVAQSALSLARAGHDVHVFTLTLPEDVRVVIPADITVHESPDLAARVRNGALAAELSAAVQSGGDGVYRLSIASLLCKDLKAVHADRPFDIVESPEVEALALPLLLDPEFTTPVVTHLHCCTALAHKFNGTTPADDRLLCALEFAAIHLSDALCAPTEAVLQATRSCCPVRTPVEIIPHAIPNPPPFDPPGEDGPILFVGRLERLKGVETLAEALNIFLPNHPKATFRFVGPDTSTAPGRTSMRQWIEARLRADLRSRVQFTGELPGRDIAREWKRARFGVMPSLWENFSMALGEAMSQSRTAIVAHGTGSVELVGNGGLLVPQGSPAHLAAAMDRLWSDRDALHHFSRSAHGRVMEFDPAGVAGKREGFYEKVMERAGVTGRREKLSSLPPQCASELLPALLRMTQFLSGVETDSTTPGGRLLGVMKELESASGTPARILLYGAGKHTARLLSERHVWESRSHRVVGIIDDHPRFAQSPVYLDLPVQSMESATARVLAGQVLPPVVLSTDTYEDQFWAQSAPLRKAGVRVFRLYSSAG